MIHGFLIFTILMFLSNKRINGFAKLQDVAQADVGWELRGVESSCLSVCLSLYWRRV